MARANDERNKIVGIMKKRRKDDDDSCLVQFVKTILLLACVYWGLITAMRTVDDSWWLIGGIAVVSYLLVKLFKDDDYVSMHTCTLAVVLGAISSPQTFISRFLRNNVKLLSKTFTVREAR